MGDLLLIVSPIDTFLKDLINVMIMALAQIEIEGFGIVPMIHYIKLKGFVTRSV